MSRSGRRLATNKAPKLSKLKGRLSSGAEAGNSDAYSDDVSRRLCYKDCGVSGASKNISEVTEK